MLEGPEAVDPEAAIKEVATAVTVQVQLDQGTHLVFQTYIPRDAPISQYHATTDKLFAVIERRGNKAQLVGLKTTIAADEETFKSLAETYEGIGDRYAKQWRDSGRKGEPKIGPKEQAEKHNSEQTLKALKAKIAANKELLSKLEKELAKDG